MLKIRVNIYSTLSCAGFILSSTCDSYWELSAWNVVFFFFFQLIVVHFTGVHRSSLSYPYRGYAFSPQCTHVGFSPVRFFSQWNVSEHSTHLIPSRRYTVTVIIGCLVSLSPSLCHGNESVLDQGRSLSLNLRKSRPHSLALTCSLELQQLFSTFMRY